MFSLLSFINDLEMIVNYVIEMQGSRSNLMLKENYVVFKKQLFLIFSILSSEIQVVIMKHLFKIFSFLMTQKIIWCSESFIPDLPSKSLLISHSCHIHTDCLSSFLGLRANTPYNSPSSLL